MKKLFGRLRSPSKCAHVLVFVLFTISLPLSAVARTWYVTVDAAGDAPTIQAGIDSAAARDTVLVGPGTYTVDGTIEMKEAVILRSALGVMQTKIIALGENASIRCYRFHVPNTEISGFWIDGLGGSVPGAAAVDVYDCEHLYVLGNVFTNNHQTAIMVHPGGFSLVEVDQNTFFGNGVAVESHNYTTLVNNIIWDRAVGGFGRCNDCLNIGDCNGPNFSSDPQFCGIPGSGNLFLQSDSPCAPGSPWGNACGLIGALPVGCGTVNAESRTWGAIKERYNK